MLRSQILSLLVAGAGLLASSAAQTPRDAGAPAGTSPLSGTGAVAGRVLLIGVGVAIPVRRARVTLDGGSTAPLQTTDTDTDGRFRFDRLPAGSYRVIAEKPGFVPQTDPLRVWDRPAAFEVKAGQSITSDVAMQRGSALEGRLVNDAGDPVANTIVSAVRLVYGPYGRRPSMVRQGKTDDLGRYRVHTLPPGDYYLEAAPDSLSAPPAMPGAPRPPGLARSYYPGTARVDEARAIPLSVGQEVTGLDFALSSVPLAAVSVRVNDASGKPAPNFGIRLQRVGAPPGEVRGYSMPQTNQAEFPAVPPGDYYVIATALPAAGADLEDAATRVAITGANVPSLSLTTARGAVVAGLIDVDDASTPLPSGLQVVAYETEFEVPSLREPVPAPSTAPGAVGRDRAFMFSSLFGRRVFRVDKLPEGWALKSVSLDGVDVTETPVDFQNTEKPRALRVVIAPRTAVVTGTVADGRGQPAGNVRVLIFSDDARLWGLRSRFVKTTSTAGDGGYTFRGLLPGKYHIVAMPYMDDAAGIDPDILARLAPTASAVVVADRETVRVPLKIGG